MKKAISFLLALITSICTFSSCTSNTSSDKASSSEYADYAWLEARLGTLPDNLSVGTSDSLGIDMSDFEDDGYIIRANENDIDIIICGKNENGLDRAVRKYAKNVKYGVTTENITYHEGYRIKHLSIDGRDISEYTAVYTDMGTPMMETTGRTLGNGEFSAKEFVRLTKEATGVEIPLVTVDKADFTKPYILFETDETYTENGEGGEYGFTGYEYRTENGNLIFRGSGLSAGCSNGVYMFFERECGWLNLTYGDANLLEAEHIEIDASLS